MGIIKLKRMLNEMALGDCYQVSGLFMMNILGDKQHKLVHSMVDGQGPLKGLRFGHAWIEYGNRVIDNSNGKHREYPKDVYYALGHVTPKDTKYYTPEETMKWLLKKKNWGPWEMSGDTIKLHEEIPTSSNEIGKRHLRVPEDLLKKIQ